MPEVSSPSLSLASAVVRVDCLRTRLPPSVRWFGADGKLLWDSADLASFRKLTRRVCRTTIVENGEGGIVSTPEHLAAAFLLWPERSFEVHLQSAELPLLDGSAYPWFKAVRPSAGAVESIQFYEAPVSARWEWGNGFCEVRPSETFEVEYSLSHGAYADSAFVAVFDAEDLFPVLHARTFIFVEDYDRVRREGLLAGVDESCGLLLNTNSLGALEPVNGGPLRHSQEPLLHKILDLVGDLSLPRPILPRLRIRIHNGGHIAHHQILERLLQYVPS